MKVDDSEPLAVDNVKYEDDAGEHRADEAIQDCKREQDVDVGQLLELVFNALVDQTGVKLDLVHYQGLGVNYFLVL